MSNLSGSLVLAAALILASPARQQTASANAAAARIAHKGAAEAPPDTAKLIPVRRYSRDSVGFSVVLALGVGKDGSLLVAEGSPPTLLRFSPDGLMSRLVGRRGSGPGEFSMIGSVVVMGDGRIVARDMGLSRLVVWDSLGRPVATHSTVTGEQTGQLGLRLLDDESLLLGVDKPPRTRAEVTSLALFVMGSLGDPRLRERRLPLRYSLACPAVRLSSPPEIVVTQYPTPVGTVTGAGEMVAGCPAKYEFDLFQGDTVIRTVTRRSTPVLRSEEERRSLVEQFARRVRREIRDWSWQGPAIPVQHPFYSRILVSIDGRLWFRTPRPSTQCESGEECGWRSRYGFDVFESDGRFVGSVSVPPEFRFAVDPVIRGDSIWALTSRLDGEFEIVRYAVKWR